MVEYGRAEVIRLLPPEKWIDRQLTSLEKVGRDNYKVGIAMPKFDPIAKGVLAEPRYADEMRKVLDEGRRAKGLKASSFDEWFGYSMQLGVPRLVDGVKVRRAEVEKFVGAFQPMLLSKVRELDQMDVTTLEDRKSKVIQNIDNLVAMKGTWKK
jgi:hypothetical protein